MRQYGKNFSFQRVIAKKVLINYLKENFTSQNPDYKKQDDWRFIVLHDMRVAKYAAEICQTENFDSESRNLVLIAAIFHDIGYCKNWKEHAELGAEIVKELLPPGKRTDKIIELIVEHNKKEIMNDIDKQHSVLKDADLLDGKGAMSVLRFAREFDYDKPDYYIRLRKKLFNRDLKYCREQKKLLRTEKGREICQQKINFIEQFVQQLKYETGDFFNELNLINKGI